VGRALLKPQAIKEACLNNITVQANVIPNK